MKSRVSTYRQVAVLLGAFLAVAALFPSLAGSSESPSPRTYEGFSSEEELVAKESPVLGRTGSRPDAPSRHCHSGRSSVCCVTAFASLIPEGTPQVDLSLSPFFSGASDLSVLQEGRPHSFRFEWQERFYPETTHVFVGVWLE